MPASNKMLKRRELGARIEAGIGDSKGRLPHKEIRVAVMAKCAKCGTEIRTSKTNTEIKAHATSKHPTFPFKEVWPDQPDPQAEALAEAEAAAAAKAVKEFEKLKLAANEANTEGNSAAADGAEGTVFGAMTANADAAAAAAATPVVKPKKKKPAEDLSFLDAGVAAIKGSKKK